MVKYKYGYRIWPQTESRETNTRHVEICLYWLRDTGQARYGEKDKRLFSLRWQADRLPRDDGQDRYWYGMRLTIGDIDDIDGLAHITRVARRLLTDNYWFHYTPQQFVESCEAKRVHRIYYDGRLDRLVPLEAIPDIDLCKFLAQEGHGSQTFYVSCLAHNESDAQLKMPAEFVKASDSYGPSYLRYLETWIKNGKIVRNRTQEQYGGKPAVIESTFDLLRLDEVEPAILEVGANG